MFPVLQPVEAAEDWKAHPEQKDVKTDREWKINFSDIATKDKIKDIRVTSGDRNIAVTPTYNKTKTVKVKANHRYLSGSKHTLEIELANGRKDRMSFTTAVENIGTNERIYTGEKIEGNATKSKHYYSIRPTEDGELTIEGSTKGNMTIYLYDREKEKGEFLGFTKEKEDPILRRNLQKDKIYYIAVIADAKYELSTSLSPKSVTKDSALEKAQAEVNALPAPMDVSEKHKYEIDQAKSFIALARLFGADSLQIEGLEEKIAKLEEVIEPLAIVNTEVLNASTFDIQFNRAVDPELVTIELGEETIDRKYISFNGNRTFATVKMPRTLKEEDSKVSVSLPLMEPLTATLDVEDEKVATLEILGDTAVRVAGDKVSIGYKALNQYGEEMDNPKVTATAEGNVVNGKPSFEDGRVLIPIDPDKIQEGEEIELTLSSSKDGEKVTETKKTVQVSIKASLYQLNVIGLESDSDSTTLNETTDLNEEDFYLVVKATDQFGGLITNLNELSGDAFSATSTNPSVVTVSDKFEEHDEETGLYKLKLIGNPQDDGTASLPSVGRTSIVLTAHASNQKSKPFAITVGEGQRVDRFTLEQLEGVTAGSDLEIEIQAKDKEGKPITDLDIVKSSVSGITWTIEPSIEPKVKKVVEGKNEQLYLTFEGKDVEQGMLKITGVTSTNQQVEETITVEEQAKPTTWEWNPEVDEPQYDFVKGDTSTEDEDESDEEEEESSKGESTEEKERVSKEKKNGWDSEIIKLENFIVKDQYGSEMDLPKGYSLQGHTNDRAVEVTGKITNDSGKITVKPKAVGKATVTISLYNGNEEVVESRKVFTFTTKDHTGYLGYTLIQIGPIYDAQINDDLEQELEKYNQEVRVLGEADGLEEILTEGYKVIAGTGLELVEGTNELAPKKNIYYPPGVTERTGSYTVKIESTGEELTQDVIISKEKPKVEKFEIEEPSITFEKEEMDDEFKVGWKEILKEAKFTATDQYGVTVVSEDESFEFPDGTKIEPTVIFERKAGGQLMSSDNATVLEFTEGSKVEAVIQANNKTITVPIILEGERVTTLKKELDQFKKGVTSASSKNGTGDPEDDNETTEKPWELKEEINNILEEGNAKLDDSYTVTIKSSSNKAISKDGKVTPGTVKIDGKVTFTVAHTKNTNFKKDFIKNINVPKSKKVLIDSESVPGIEAGDTEITGLQAGYRYVVYNLVEKKFYAVKEDGRLRQDGQGTLEKASEDTKFLEVNSIKGLENGVRYRIQKAMPDEVESLQAELNNDETSISLTFNPISHADDNAIKVEMREKGGSWKGAGKGPNGEDLNLSESITSQTESVDIIGLSLKPGKKYEIRLKIDDERYQDSSNIIEISTKEKEIENVTLEFKEEPILGQKYPNIEDLLGANKQFTVKTVNWIPNNKVFEEGKNTVTIVIEPNQGYKFPASPSTLFDVVYAKEDTTKFSVEEDKGTLKATFEIGEKSSESEGPETDEGDDSEEETVL